MTQIKNNDRDERSAPSGLTNKICKQCAAVTAHIHSECIACIEREQDESEQADHCDDLAYRSYWSAGMQSTKAQLDIPLILEQIDQEIKDTEEEFQAWLEFMDQEITATQDDTTTQMEK